MLITLGMGTAVGYAGVVVELADSSMKNVRKPIITAIVLFISFLFSMVYITPGGQHVLQLVDYFNPNFVLVILAALESISSKFFAIVFSMIESFFRLSHGI